MTDQTPAPESPAPPLLRVVAGDPSPEELAALVAVVASLGSAAAAPPRRTPEWQARHRTVRAPHHPGPAGWRSGGLPR